jgi:nucleotide-binding universal stress UspA family protein
VAADIKPGWSRPSTILFVSEIPTNETAFGSALAQAAEVGADLILFHAYDTSAITPLENSRIDYGDHSAAFAGKLCLDRLAQRASDLGIRCKVVVRPGLAAEQILRFLSERKIDRVVMGSHSPGPIGSQLVGSVAEAVLRKAIVPVCIVGPSVFEGSYRTVAARNILCDVSAMGVSHMVARFGAEVAASYHADLILQQVIPPQQRAEVLADRTIDQIEAELPSLVPVRLQHKVSVRAKVALGDPTEELLCVCRTQQAHLIVLGVRDMSHFAAVTRASPVFKVVADAHCPVIALSPIVLADCGVKEDRPRSFEAYMAGVF